MKYINKLKEYREKARLSPKNVSNILNISLDYYLKLESNIGLETEDSLKYEEFWNEICKMYKCNINNIVEIKGLNLKEVRIKYGYTKEDFALFLDLDSYTYSNLEKGKASISMAKLFSICKVCKDLNFYDLTGHDMVYDLSED